ncbi:MAG: hypothetical protein CTR53_05460 [Ferrovibrio sp.]|nr:MAG: hypothetical protein CTR53_05460 [Ferrovibrio sp.]
MREFTWPVSRAGLLATRDAFITACIGLARQQTNADWRDWLSVLSPHAMAEVMTVYSAWALRQHCRNSGQACHTVPQNRLLSSFLRDQCPQGSLLADRLRQGMPKPSGLRLPLRIARSLLVRDGLRRLYFGEPGAQPGPVVITTSGRISAHARRNNRPVTYIGPHVWFGPLAESDLKAATAAVSESGLAEVLVRIAAEAFAAGGVALEGAAREYLADYFLDALAGICARLKSLLERPERLPRELWTGAGSPIWPRLLRHAVRRAGGWITGFDHTPGSSYTTSIQKTVVDFEACNEFRTISPGQAEAYPRWTLRLDLLVQPHPPVIVGHEQVITRARTARPDKIRRVMLVTSEYTTEMERGLPLLPVPVLVDWHARLLGRLKALGYEVLLKGHPESDQPFPDAFSAITGQPPLQGRFENLASQADAVIFDWSRTTTLAAALQFDLPIVHIDFGLGFLTNQADAMLSRRCATVRGWLDRDNRCQIAWDELQQAIETAPGLTDREFEACYLNLQ